MLDDCKDVTIAAMASLRLDVDGEAKAAFCILVTEDHKPWDVVHALASISEEKTAAPKIAATLAITMDEELLDMIRRGYESDG
ncbi:hypothetical protein C0995_001918 [Termitomyces sp. Mi166|nr:hypothetical protein C0995_001918 [Termitomyces sp. Mi166\